MLLFHLLLLDEQTHILLVLLLLQVFFKQLLHVPLTFEIKLVLHLIISLFKLIAYINYTHISLPKLDDLFCVVTHVPIPFLEHLAQDLHSFLEVSIDIILHFLLIATQPLSFPIFDFHPIGEKNVRLPKVGIFRPIKFI